MIYTWIEICCTGTFGLVLCFWFIGILFLSKLAKEFHVIRLKGLLVTAIYN